MRYFLLRKEDRLQQRIDELEETVANQAQVIIKKSEVISEHCLKNVELMSQIEELEKQLEAKESDQFVARDDSVGEFLGFCGANIADPRMVVEARILKGSGLKFSIG